jgi:hypothetical protein
MSYNEPDTLPEYLVPEDTTFEMLGVYIKGILKRFEAGEISMNDVINHGDSIETFIHKKYGTLENGGYPWFPKEHRFSIPFTVIDYMHNSGGNYVFLMLPRDVPHFINFLGTPIGKEKEGYETFENYIRSLTLRDRIPEEEKMGFFHANSRDLDKPFEPLFSETK